MKPQIRKPSVILLLSFAIFASCSKSSDSDTARAKLEEENARLKRELAAAPAPSLDSSRAALPASTTSTVARPTDEQIHNDCQRLVETTMADEKGNILRMDGNTVDGVAPSGQTCEVLVRLSVSFLPCDVNRGYMIWGGGAAALVSGSDVATLRGGNTPSGQRVYNVRLSYRRYDTGWRLEQAR
jgi:hypothetical protein